MCFSFHHGYLGINVSLYHPVRLCGFVKILYVEIRGIQYCSYLGIPQFLGSPAQLNLSHV